MANSYLQCTACLSASAERKLFVLYRSWLGYSRKRSKHNVQCVLAGYFNGHAATISKASLKSSGSYNTIWLAGGWRPFSLLASFFGGKVFHGWRILLAVESWPAGVRRLSWPEKLY